MSASTPTKPLTQPIQDSPGTWRHPRLAEINRRQEATTFSEKNVRRIAVNICAFAALFVLKLLLVEVLPSKQRIPKRYANSPASTETRLGPDSFPLLPSLIEWSWFLFQGACFIPPIQRHHQSFPLDPAER